MTPEILQKYQQLKNQLVGLGRVAIAFSGGVDSTFLCKAAQEALGDDSVAITATSETLAPDELAEAKSLAEEIGIRHIVVEARELDDDRFRANPPDRCYHCKKLRFGALRKVAIELGFPVLVEGANADDVMDYRPGLAASEEMGVVRPLMDVGLTKDEIRQLSRHLGLPTWNKPAMACLASRVPYGVEITPENLAQIAAAEKFLRDLGFRVVRVRHHGNVARIEVGGSERERLLALGSEVDRKLKEIGFKFVTMDLAGYQTGSLNSELNLSTDGRAS